MASGIDNKKDSEAESKGKGRIRKKNEIDAGVFFSGLEAKGISIGCFLHAVVPQYILRVITARTQL